MCRARLDELFEKHVGDAERRARLAAGLLESVARADPPTRTTRMPRPPPPIDALTITG